MDLKIYTDKKEILMTKLQQLYIIAKDLELRNKMNSIGKNIECLDREKFELVVVGEFSRGKSTFVNAMLGKKILPARKKATTAVISKIIYSDEPKYYLHYKDETKNIEEISEEKFLKLIAPKESAPEEEKKSEQDFLDTIDFADIAYPLEFCKDNVEIVDTPGINDINQNRIEITYRYLNQADAVIMLLSATQALSNSEVEFLKERILGNHIQNIFFVVTHKDELDEISEQKVLNFVTKNIRDILPENITMDNRIFLVSSIQTLAYRMVKNGLELPTKTLRNNYVESLEHTGFNEFEDALAYFLTEEKGRAKINKYVSQSESIIADLNKKIYLQKELIMHSADDLKDKVAKMEPEFNGAKYNVKQIAQDMRIKLSNNISEIEDKLVDFESNICRAVDEAIDDYTGDLKNVSKMKTLIKKVIEEEQKKFIDEMQTIEAKKINEAMQETESKLNKIWQDISVEYQQNFNLPVVATTGEESILYEVVNDFEKEFDTKSNLLLYGIGGGIGLVFSGVALFPVVAALGAAAWFMGFFEDENLKIKRQIKNKFVNHYRNVSKEIAQNVKKGYLNQIDKVCSSVEKVANARIEDMENQLNTIIKQKENKEHSIEIECQKLNDKQNKLMKINAELNTLKL